MPPNAKFDNLKSKQTTVPLGLIAGLLLLGVIVTFVSDGGFIGKVIALGLLGLNLVWTVKLFANRVNEFKKMTSDGDALAAGLKSRLAVPFLYVVSLGAAAFFPIIWALVKFALALALGAAVVALIAVGVLYFLGRTKAKEAAASNDPPVAGV